MQLNATGDSGLHVHYYVAYGPPVVIKGRLNVRQLTPRAAFPIPVKVVACRLATGVDHLLKTAKPGEQTIQIRCR